MKHLAVIGLFLAGFAMSCGNAKETMEDVKMNDFALNDTVRIVLEEMVICSDDLKLFVQFDEVLSDSRCPRGANCIWEGDASVKLSVTHKKQMDSLRLHTNKLGEKRKSIFGYSFELVNLNPYPGDDVDETKDKSIELIIKENN